MPDWDFADPTPFDLQEFAGEVDVFRMVGAQDDLRATVRDQGILVGKHCAINDAAPVEAAFLGGCTV